MIQFVDLHTHHPNFAPDILSVYNCYPDSRIKNHPFSISIHPWYINKNTIDDEFKLLEKMIPQENCVAIGECGLDKIKANDLELQLLVFKHQIMLSEKFKKPIIIHCVKAYQEIIHLKKEMQPKQPWIIHGFNKKKQLANSLKHHDFILSFGADLLKKEKLQQVFLEMPLTKVFLETDDTDVSIRTIYEKAAMIKEIELDSLKQHIFENYKNHFKR